MCEVVNSSKEVGIAFLRRKWAHNVKVDFVELGNHNCIKWSSRCAAELWIVDIADRIVPTSKHQY